MKQLITRLDDALHRRLKERAAEQQRSVNDLVRELLAAAVEDDTAALRRRIDQSGLRVLPPPPAAALARETAIARQRGTGRAVSAALDAERNAQ